MNPASKNRILVWLVVLLLIANAATITVFWLGRTKRPARPQAEAREFLVKELDLDSNQQLQFEKLRNEHRAQVDSLREKVKEAKDKLFDLAKDPASTDSAKTEAAGAVSRITERIDLFTVEHFQKIRALCRPDQQKRFDEILNQVASMMGPRPPMPPPRPGEGPGRRPGRPEGDGPPPPPQD